MIFKFVSMPLQSDTFNIKCIGRGADDEVISFDVYDERYTVIDLFGEDVGLINVGDLFFLEHSNTMLNGSWGFVREVEKKKDNSIVNVTLGFKLSGLDLESVARTNKNIPLDSIINSFFRGALGYASVDQYGYTDENWFSFIALGTITNIMGGTYISGNPADIDINIGDIKSIGEYEKNILRNFRLLVLEPYITTTQFTYYPYRYLTFDIKQQPSPKIDINLNGVIDYEILINPTKTAYEVIYNDGNDQYLTYGIYGLDSNLNFVWYYEMPYYEEGTMDEDIDSIYKPSNIGTFVYDGEIIDYEITSKQFIEIENAIKSLIEESQDSDNITITFDLNNYIYKDYILTEKMYDNLGKRLTITHEGITYDTRIKEISIKYNICTISFGLTNVKLFDRLKGAK